MPESHWKYVTEMNTEGFREIMVTYGQDVWNLAFIITRRRDLADDIVQDVFLQVYRNIESFRGEASMKTWLLAITRNISANALRSAFIRKVTLVEWVAPKSASPSAENEAMEHAFTNEIWEAVFKLPLKLREVLILHAKYELNVKEIASILHLPEGTVKSRLSRARKLISAGWKEEAAYE
ncbi:RNA polymerase sigma factor [Paenibacillus tarimensis]